MSISAQHLWLIPALPLLAATIAALAPILGHSFIAWRLFQEEPFPWAASR